MVSPTEIDLAQKGEDHRKNRHYFVDEAGDPALFNRRKAVIVGQNGSSRYFAIGALDVPEPKLLKSDLDNLRQRVLADPYFAGVPSFDPARGKTAIAFHAKDDVAEVRKQVFEVLLQHEVKFYAIVRDKLAVVAEVRRKNARDPNYRYSQNDLYDNLVSRLFKDRLHKGDAFIVIFARRGSSDRTEALSGALKTARDRFHGQWGITTDAPIDVIASTPKETTCLQAVDYFLWALQRRFERQEARYLNLLWSRIGLVVSADSSEAGYGTYYIKSKRIPEPANVGRNQRI